MLRHERKSQRTDQGRRFVELLLCHESLATRLTSRLTGKNPEVVTVFDRDKQDGLQMSVQTCVMDVEK